MVNEQTLVKFGLIEDKDNLKLKEIFKDKAKVKEIHIDIYPRNPLISSLEPLMLLLRTIENNAIVLSDGNRLVLKRNDRYESYFINVLFSEITECYYKISEGSSEYILNIQNIYYRITVLN